MWDDTVVGYLGRDTQGGFTCIITQDVEFQKSASKNLKRFPQMSLVLVRIRQQKGRGFLSQFEEAWKRKPISPASGQFIEWP